MKNTFIKNAIILGLSGILAKSFDFAFRAYYSRYLGTEGMGLLSLGFGLHGVMLTVSTAGLGVAVSKITSEYMEANNISAAFKSIKASLYCVSSLAMAIILITFLGAEQIASKILGDIRITTGLCGLVPSILFMGISYCLKGYFYAARKAKIPALSEFLEQAVKFTSISILLKLFLPYGITYGCFAVFLGITIGEFSSCLYLSIKYLIDFRGVNIAPYEGKVLPKILKISVPSMLTSLVGSSFRMQEEVWIVSAFKDFGMNHNEAISNLGIIYGMVFPLLTFPLNLSGSVMTLLVPEVSRANSHSHKQKLKRMLTYLYIIGISTGIFVFVVFLSFAPELTQAIYGNGEISPMLQKLAFLFPFMLTESISCSILNGLGMQCSMLLYSLTDSILRLIGITFFVPRFGITALLITIVFSSVFTCLLTLTRVIRFVWKSRK